MLKPLGGMALFATVIVILAGAAKATDDGTLVKQLKETIAKVRELNGPSNARTDAAESLAQLTKKNRPQEGR